MKRFTETEKWRDPWFQKLDRESRTLWLWLCDRVDNAGVVDICWPICNAETGGSYSEASMAGLGEKVEKLENGKWWIPKFVLFQFGELSDSQENRVHQSIWKLLNKHSLSHRVSHRVYDTPKDKDKDKDKEKKAVELVKIPDSLNLPAFVEVWKEWVSFRKKLKSCKDWGLLFKKVLQQLETYGVDGAIQSLNASIAGGWQGVFEPKGSFTKPIKKPYIPQTTEHLREAERQAAIKRYEKETGKTYVPKEAAI